MKDLTSITFDHAQCERELAAFGRLLKSKDDLSERQHFFESAESINQGLGNPLRTCLQPTRRLVLFA